LKQRPQVTAGVVDALVKVCKVSGRGTYTVRRLITGMLWNVALLDFGLEMRMVELVTTRAPSVLNMYTENTH
jgi:hypothetical protein